MKKNWYAVIGENGFVYDVFSRKDKAIQLQERLAAEKNTRIQGITEGMVHKALLRYLREVKNE